MHVSCGRDNPMKKTTLACARRLTKSMADQLIKQELGRSLPLTRVSDGYYDCSLSDTLLVTVRQDPDKYQGECCVYVHVVISPRLAEGGSIHRIYFADTLTLAAEKTCSAHICELVDQAKMNGVWPSDADEPIGAYSRAHEKANKEFLEHEEAAKNGES